MELGKPLRKILVEPLEQPLPREEEDERPKIVEQECALPTIPRR
jgi:hypothetical protein